MKKSTHIIIALLVMAATMLTACNNDDNNTHVTSFMTICTYTGNNGKGAVFTTQEDGDSPLITFTTSATIAESVLKVGDRVMLVYTNESGERYKSGAITLINVYKVYGGGIEILSLNDIEKFQTANNYYVTAVERSGKYINVIGYGNYDVQTGPRIIGLYFDEATVDQSYPEAYVVYESTLGGEATKQFFASYSIAEIWDKDTCQGIRVKYRSSNGMKYQDFAKSNLPVTPDTVE